MAKNPSIYIEQLLADFKRSPHRWIGLEVERLGVDIQTGKRLGYQEHLKALLEALIGQKAWRVEYQVGPNPLAISRQLHQISLEPGSQFEVSLAPRANIREIVKAQEQIDAEIKSLPLAKNFAWLGVGMNPLDVFEDRSLLPSPRYALMNRYFEQNKGRGREMMRLTCGLQINLDFADEREGVEMLRLGFQMMPFLSALFSNSPYKRGKKTGVLSERHLIWKQTDPLRSNFLDRVFESDFSLKKWAQMASQVPLMYAYDTEGNVLDVQGASLNDLSEPMQKGNALAAMRQIFTEVRYKPCCIELRSFDQVPPAYRYAATAICVGILYNDKRRGALQEGYSKISSAAALSKLMEEGARQGLQSDFMHSELCKLVDLAQEGLEQRGFGEQEFLQPARDLLNARQTPAEIWVKACGDQLIDQKWMEIFQG